MLTNADVTGQQLLQTSDNLVEWFHSKGPPSIIAWHNKHGADAHANAIPPLPTLQVLGLLALLPQRYKYWHKYWHKYRHTKHGADAHANAIPPLPTLQVLGLLALLYCWYSV